MSAIETDNGDMVYSEPLSPEFDRIIGGMHRIVDRLRSVRETSTTVSDALIGAQATGDGYDDCARPSSPDYFVIKCFDLINKFDEEIERLERINEAMLKSVKVV